MTGARDLFWNADFSQSIKSKWTKPKSLPPEYSAEKYVTLREKLSEYSSHVVFNIWMMHKLLEHATPFQTKRFLCDLMMSWKGWSHQRALDAPVRVVLMRFNWVPLAVFVFLFVLACDIYNV